MAEQGGIAQAAVSHPLQVVDDAEAGFFHGFNIAQHPVHIATVLGLQRRDAALVNFNVWRFDLTVAG